MSRGTVWPKKVIVSEPVEAVKPKRKRKPRTKSVSEPPAEKKEEE